jgi:integrase
MAQDNDDPGKKPANMGREPKTDLDSRTFRDGQIYLYRRQDYVKPIWFCRIKIPSISGYVSRSTRTANEHEAFRFAEDLYNRMLVKSLQGQDLKGKKVSAAITEYVEAQTATASQKLSTKLRCQYLERIKPFFGTLQLNEMTTATVVDLLAWMEKHSRGDALSPNTIKRYATDLKLFLGWCVDKDLITKIPAFPKLRVGDNRRPHFDQRDYAKLTRYLREFVKHENSKTVRDRTMLANYVLILANTGIRVGEARTLKWRDIRDIPPSKAGESANIALFVTGKTGPREVVARTPDVKTYLKRLLQLRIDELEGGKPKPDEFVFCNRDGTSVGSFKKSFATLIKDAGVEFDSHGARRSIYSLRHTYATFRLQEGVHQFILAKNMGTSTAMLERHYGHTSNIASADELTKGGSFKGGKKAQAVDWLLD